MSDGNVRERAREELRNYAIVATYLYVCFGALLLYKSALLQQAGVSPLPHGIAVVKALVLGKFILLGEAAGVGKLARGRTLAGAIAMKSVQFFALLVVLSVIEELVVGRVHGHSFAQTIAEFEQHSLLEMLATCLLLLLVLVPLIAFKEFTRVIGPGALRARPPGDGQSGNPD
jgi:hypothetical protein